MRPSLLATCFLALCRPSLFAATPPQLALNISSYQYPNCFDSDGEVHVYAVNGAAPYTYSWDDGAVGQDRTGLPAGVYTATVTDALGATATRSITLVSGLMEHPGATYAGLFACPGQADGTFVVVNSGATGTPPYTTEVTVNGSSWPSAGETPQGDPLYTGLSTWDDVSFVVTDVNGCIGQNSFTVYGPLGTPVVITDQRDACGPVGGSIRIDASLSDWPVDLQVVRDGDGTVVGSVSAAVTAWDLTGLEPGTYTVNQYWTWSMSHTCAPLVQQFTIGDLGPGCGTVSGTSWYDVDADCAQDADEVVIPYDPLLVQPGDVYVLTGTDGRFTCRLSNGAYTLEQLDPTLVPICPAAQPVPFTVASNAQVLDLANGSTVPLDLVVHAAQGVARPGMQHGQWATVRNLSAQAGGLVTITCTFDPQLIYGAASPAPAAISGNTVTWEFPAFGPFHEEPVHLTLYVPVSVPLGTPLTSTWEVTTDRSDANAANNSQVLSATVVGSFDPNDKTVRTSTGQAPAGYTIGQDRYLDYTIRFQNTGTDTAFTIVVTDTLSTDLDMASFEQGTASHPFDVTFKPGRAVEWTFPNILLPDSSTNEVGSHGLVQFRIKPHEPLIVGTVIHNNADIFFDFNAPVRTNDVVMNIQAATGVAERNATGLHVFPNPAESRVTLTSAAPMRGFVLRAADGRPVQQRTVDGSTVQLDLSGLPAGLYVLQVRCSDGTVMQERILHH